MSRLIDADKLKKDVLDLPDCYNGFSDTYDKACIIGVIDELPTIEERKKGKWIKGKCSNCGAHAPFWPMATTYYESDFCPNCGSEMQERREDE